MSRPATISPSQLNRLMAKSGLGKGAQTYADEIVMRMLGVDFSDAYESYHMRRGIELEPDAVLLYEKKTATEVHDKKDRIYHPEYEFVSGEPDRLIGEVGLVEVKCPKRKYHLANIRDGEQIDKYYNQMQGYMWIAEREWCDFISFDPRFPDGMKLAVHRIEREPETIRKIENRCVEFWASMVVPRMEDFGLEPEKQLVA